jgi:glycosyltransferase involved in cell wall biosynthesis
MKIKLTWACFLNQSGYSQAAQNYIFALNETNQFDIKIRIFGDKPTRPSVSDENYEFFMKMIKKEDDPERILVYHCIPNIQRRVKGYKKTIGIATFETFQPPLPWIEILNKNDAIITPSKFNYKIFSHMRVEKPIYYIPHCLDMNVYNKDVLPLNKYDKYTFLFMGIWRERKGYKQLIEAWLREFNQE